MNRRRRTRFTDTRIFSFFAEPCINRAQLLLTLLVILPCFSFAMFYLNRITERKAQEKLLQDLAVVRAENRQLKAAAPPLNSQSRTTSASLKVSSETETQTPAGHAHDHSDVSTSDDTVEIVHTGPFKGLPLDVAKEIHKEYTAASLARAKRYDEWDQQWQAHRKRDRALVKKELAHGDALISASNESSEQTLAFYAVMPPEQLETLRTELLKTQSAEVVEHFLRRVSELRATKSSEQLVEAAQSIQQNRETRVREMQAWQVKFEQLKREREQLKREREQLMRTKPLSPNIDLNEFYTEWKKRNSTKPTPP